MGEIKRSDFISQQFASLFKGRYRIRLLEASKVPIVGDLSIFKDKQTIVIDLPPNPKESPKTVRDDMSRCGDSNASGASPGYAGSPLKFSFMTLEKLRRRDGYQDPTFLAELDANEAAFECNPVPSKDGRRLVNSLATEEWPFDRKSLKAIAVWVVMDASDAMKTSLLGVSRTEDLLVTYSVRCFARGDITVEDYIQPNFRFLDQLQPTFTAYCSYDLIPPRPNVDTDAATRITANVQLLANWRAKREDLLVQPPRSAPVSLSVCVGWLDKRLPYTEWSNELCIILALGSALRTGTMNWQPIDPTITSHQLNASVKALLEEEELGRTPAGDWAEYRDLSERLWVVLKNCSSNRMLVDALQIVWNALRSGYKNTMMHSNNMSTIARLMKDACAGDLKLPRLEGLTPLEILLEAGLEYFHRSCIHQYISSGFVVSGSELESLYPINPRAATEDRADVIFVLYQALVAMSSCKQYLHLDTQQRNILARRVLSHYSALKISPTSEGMVTEDIIHKLHLNLDMSAKLNDVYPSVFKIKTPMTWRKESIYLDGKNVSYIVMPHFARSTRLPYIAFKTTPVDSYDLQLIREDENLHSEWNVGDESKEISDETKSDSKSTRKRARFDGYYSSLLIASFNPLPFI
uniref:Protein zwilch n=1 Tax=Parascaris univalens TaxID=6257 RepID=A0A915ASB0_PARUN